MNNFHKANQQAWESISPQWKKLRDQDGFWQRIPYQPELAFDGEALAMIKEYTGDLQGKSSCVIGSGDNYVAFALAGMGARVTSTDISTGQLEIARQRAELLELDIQFIQTDAASMDLVSDEQYDLVCSSNGFFVWISDPGAVFRQVERVLKPGGFYIFYDLHPFQRPWKDPVSPLEMERPYVDTGPYTYEDEGQPTFEFYWRLSDLINPLLEAGLILRRLAESPAQDARFWKGPAYTSNQETHLLDWKKNPRSGLPVWLTVAAQKT